MYGTENETIARSMVAPKVPTTPGVAGRRQHIGVGSESYYLLWKAGRSKICDGRQIYQ